MSKDYWLHRISHEEEVSEPLLFKKNILSIGFSAVYKEDNNFISNCNNNKEAFETYIYKVYGERLRSRHSLWRFIYEMKEGDYVIVPRPRTFSVYEIEKNGCMVIDDLKKEGVEVEGKDLGFFRKVKRVIIDASRRDFANSALTSRMKIRNTNAWINDLEDNIERTVKRVREGKPINLHKLIIDKNLENTLSTIRSELSDSKFEKLVEWYLKKTGATKTDIPSKNHGDKEGDADVTAIFDQIKTIIYVQAKFHDGKTSEEAFEQIKDYIGEGKRQDDYSELAWIVSTADDFSEECKKRTKEYNEKAKIQKIQLINGKQFATMLLEAGVSSLSDIFD